MNTAKGSSDTSLGWAGSIAFGANWLLYTGPIGPTEAHAHHARQIIVSDGPENMEVETAERLLAGAVIRIPSDVRHSIRRSAAIADVLFFEPTGGSRSHGGDATELGPPRPLTSWESAVERANTILPPIAPAEESVVVTHAAVDAALSHLPDMVADGPVSAHLLAELVGLSPSRLSHVFVRQTGVPIRTYVRWARLRIAAECLSRGQSLTAAAHTAGFSDSSHFSRTFRSMFGLSPTDVFAGSSFLTPG